MPLLIQAVGLQERQVALAVLEAQVAVGLVVLVLLAEAQDRLEAQALQEALLALEAPVKMEVLALVVKMEVPVLAVKMDLVVVVEAVVALEAQEAQEVAGPQLAAVQVLVLVVQVHQE